MASEEKPLSEFPRALQVAEQALVMISNPDGLGGYDTNGALLTEVGRAILAVQYTQQLGNVSVFDAIKNCRVLSGTTTPTANEGANGQLYVKYETVSNVDTVIGMYFKKDGAWLEISLGGGGNTNYIECTQAQYDAWEQAGTLDPDTLYFITDGQAGGSSTLAGLSDVDITSPADGQLLRYNGTSGKWENAGIINDTTASASSVYSSSKTDTLLSDKANSADVYMKSDFAIKTASVSTTTVAASDLATVDVTVNDSKMNIIAGFVIADSVSVVAVQVWFTTSTNIRLRVRNVSNTSTSFSAYIKYI